jgi:Mg-chelatase subunit ChlD
MAPAADAPEVDVAIVFLADMSKSMDTYERRVLRQSHASAIASPTVIEAIEDGEHGRVALAYVEYGNDPIVRVPWSIVEGKSSAEDFAAAILRSPMENLGLTGIGGGIRAAEALFARCPCRPARRVVDVVGDGKNNTTPSLYIARMSLLDTGATINGLPMIIAPWNDDIVDYFARNVIGGPGAFNLPVDSMDELPERLRQKILLDLY